MNFYPMCSSVLSLSLAKVAKCGAVPQFGAQGRARVCHWCGDGGMKSSASTASLDSERLPPIASKRKPGGNSWYGCFFFFRRWAPGHG